jgi:enoyl-CoA hydratase
MTSTTPPDLYGTLPDEVRVTSRGAVRIVTLNRPDDSNAVNQAMHDGIKNVWGLLAADHEARAVVLTGNGRHFSAGGDMDQLLRVASDLELRRRTMRDAKELVVGMTQFHLPVVAAVNGAAVGLGCSLVVLCDIVLMHEKAFISDPHVPLGLVAGDGGAVLWPLLVSMLRAKEYIFTGKRIPAAECERIGLCNRVVAGDVLEEALTLAEELAALPAQSVQETKRAMNMHIERAMAGVLEFALAAESESFIAGDVLEKVAEFRGR